MSGNSIIAAIVGPLIAFLLSMGFTLWREKRANSIKKKETFIQETEFWVKNILDLCQRFNDSLLKHDISVFRDKINRINTEGCCLLEVRGVNKKLEKRIAELMAACSIFSCFPDEIPDTEQKQKINMCCDSVLLKTSEIRYGKK